MKHYLHEGKGVIVDNIWTDISPVNSQALEDTRYPTQKPEALLERIINEPNLLRARAFVLTNNKSVRHPA